MFHFVVTLKSFDNLCQKNKYELENISKWFKWNKLPLNVKKLMWPSFIASNKMIDTHSIVTDDFQIYQVIKKISWKL